MSASGVTLSAFKTALKRYSRSKGLWLLLLIGLLGTRFWVPRDDGTTVIIAVNQQLPAMTSAVLGTSLGIVVSTLLLPFGFIYLRSNTTRRQPWQVDEVTAASRIGISLGSFLADTAIFGSLLATMTVAGYGLAWIMLQHAEIHFWQIAVALWLIGAPSLMGLAAARALLDALPWTRRALGDVIFFAFWFTSLAIPLFMSKASPGLAADLIDFGGFAQPLMHFARAGTQDLQIGLGASIRPGRISIDVMSVLLSRTYLEARLFWALIAILVTIAAGIFYRPHVGGFRSKGASAFTRWQAGGLPPAPPYSMVPARRTAQPWLGLTIAEFRLIFPGRLLLLANLLIGIAGFFASYRHIVSPAILLTLTFGLTSSAARSETRGMLSLTATTFMTPASRRLSFCVAGLCWTLLLSLPALLIRPSSRSLNTALAIGVIVPFAAMTLSALSRSAFAARLILLIAWFGYIST